MGKKRRNNPKLGHLEKVEQDQKNTLEVKLPFSDKALGLSDGNNQTNSNPESISNLTSEFKLPPHVRATMHTTGSLGISQKSKINIKKSKKQNAKKSKLLEKAMDRAERIEGKINRKESKNLVKDNMKKIWD